MTLNRTVMMSDGILRRIHNVFKITHIANGSTHIEIASRVKDPAETNPWYMTVSLPFDDTITFERAYTIIADRPEFAEYESADEEVNAELLDRIDAITAEAEQTAAQLVDANAATQHATEKLTAALSVIDDETALTIASAFPDWKAGIAYNMGDRVYYVPDTTLYKCVQSHTSQDDWTPPSAASLWSRVAQPSPEGEPPEWVQPTGAHDAYNTDDVVTHNGKKWICIVDANVYEPGVYGWEEIA